MNIKVNRSFEDVFRAVLLTSGGGKAFPKTAKNALETMALADRLTMEGGIGARDQIPNEAARDAAGRYGIHPPIRP
jgi:hypothetical protein